MSSIVADGIVILIVALMLFAAIRYIYISNKKESKCIGCPSASSCNHSCDKTIKD